MNEEFEQNVPETAQEKDLDAERNDIQNEEPVNEPENASAPEQETVTAAKPAGITERIRLDRDTVLRVGSFV